MTDFQILSYFDFYRYIDIVQNPHLVSERKRRKRRQVFCPLDGHEKQTSGSLVNVLV